MNIYDFYLWIHKIMTFFYKSIELSMMFKILTVYI